MTKKREVEAPKNEIALPIVDSWANTLAMPEIGNVLTDFASFPVGHVSQTNIHSYQSKVGEWINELLEANKKVDFKLENFIGEEAISNAEKLEEAIPVDVQEYYPVQQRQQAIRWDY